MGTIAKVTAGGATHYIASSAYCICTTAAGTAAKVANLIGDQADNASTAAFTLIKGTTVHVKFTYGNTAGSATLNVGGTGAKNICRYGTTAVGTNVHTSWRDGAIVSFTYDGTSWVMNNYIENTDTNTTALGSMSGTLAIGHGGTGATDAATARSNLGITPGNIGAATSGHTHTTSLASGGTSTINLAANTAYTLTAGGTSLVFKTPPDNNTTYTFTAGTSTLAWNSEVTLATVGGLAIKAKLPANPNTDHYAWGDITSKPATATRWPTWDEVTSKPSSFTPASHTHNYAGSSSAGGAATSLANFKVSTTSNLWAVDSPTTNAVGYQSGLTKANWNYQQTDGALYAQFYSSSWMHEIFGDYRTGQISVRGKNNGTWQSWRRILDESNAATILGLGSAAYTAKTAYAPASHTHNYAVSGHTHTTSLASGGTSTINLAANTAYTLTAGGTSVVFKTPADNNTWRGIVNNLTSDSTTDSLSAAQGKALKALVDGKAAASHTHSYAASNHTHGISIAADSGTNQLTLAASTKYKLTAGGSSYIFTTPPNTNTDTKVTQTAISTEKGAYPILFAGSTSTSTATEGAKKASTLWFQAEEDALYANSVQTTDLNGVFVHTDVANNYVIYANQWTSGICELTHSCTVTDKTLITISPGFSITAEQLKAYQSANIVGIGQNATTFKLKCFGSVPTISIPINIGIFNS